MQVTSVQILPWSNCSLWWFLSSSSLTCYIKHASDTRQRPQYLSVRVLVHNEINSVPQIQVLKPWPPGCQNVAIFRYRAFREVINY